MTSADSVAAELRNGLRRLAKAVVVITSQHAGVRYAMAATAVSELSMEPPSLLACVNQSASLALPLQEGADFSINILHSSYASLAALCSGPAKGEARFTVGDWQTSDDGLPYVGDAQATFFCRFAALYAHGSHFVVIGNVIAVRATGLVDPLIYVDGRYAATQESIQ